MMKNYRKLMLACALGSAGFMQAGAETPMAYGIRVFSDSDPGDGSYRQSVVSFPVDNPSAVTEVHSLGDLYMRAAECHDGKYYMLQSDDGAVAYSLYTYDLNTERLEQVATYSPSDVAGALIVIDMAWDPVGKKMYAMGFDLSKAEVVDEETGEMDIPFGLFTVDTATGEFRLVGYQDFMLFVAMAFDAEGYLFGVTDGGELWTINKNNGRPGDNMAYSHHDAAMLQSMAFDYAANELYWACFNSDGSEESVEAGLGKFKFYEDIILWEDIASFPHHDEIIGLYIDPETLAAMAPGRVENLTVTPGVEGAPTATLTWTNPEVTVSGEPLTGTLDITVMRGDEQVATLTGLEPGAKGEYTDSGVEAGEYTYTLIPSNAAGEGRMRISESVYIGVDVPGTVGDLRVKKGSNYNMTVSWTAPTVGAHGGWFNPVGLRYKVVRFPDNVTLTSETSMTEYVDKSITQLAGYRYEITPFNQDGAGMPSLSPCVVDGPALSAPQTFDFSAEPARDLWTAIADPNGDGWEPYCFTASDLWCMRYYPTELIPADKGGAWLISPPLNLKKGSHYSISYKLRGYGNLTPVDFKIAYGEYATAGAMTNVITEKQQMTDADVSFVEFENMFEVERDGVYYIGFGVDNLSPLWLTDVNIGVVHPQDLALSPLQGSIIGNVGTAKDYVVTFKNVGYEPIELVDFRLRDANGVNLSHAEYRGTLQPLESGRVSMRWAPSQTGEYEINALAWLPSSEDYIDSPSLKVNVLDPGEWHDINVGGFESGVVPFFASYPHSFIESLYHKDEIGGGPSTVDAIIYYYNVYANRAVAPFNAKVYMANTSLDSFTASDWIAPEDMTLVWAGEIEVDPFGRMCPIILDRPFDYTGGNLAILTVQENAGDITSDLRWLVNYGEGLAGRCVYYRGETPFAGEMTDTADELPDISIITSAGSGIGSIDGSVKIVATEYYNLQGIRSMSAPAGVGIRIDRFSDGTRRVTKLAR